jgi:signal transduction histidine kinase
MDQNALAYLFGGISAGTVGFAFLYKWTCEDRRDYDGAWAVAHLALALAILFGAINEEYQSRLFGTLIAFIFWHYIAFSVLGNLRFVGRRCPVWAAVAGGMACGIIGLAIGLNTMRGSMFVYVTSLSLVEIWTAFILRREPQLGRTLFVVLLFRALIVNIRPWAMETPYILHYSILSFSSAFLAGLALLTASLLRSREALLSSRRDLERANQELARLNSGYESALRRAESANRAKDSFIANINHEFRTPLNAIIGFAKLMRMDAETEDRAKLKEYAGYVDEAGNGLLSRIKRILEYVAFDSGDRTIDREPFVPRRVLEREIAGFSEALAAKRVMVEIDEEAGPQSCVGDPRAFATIAQELISNAVKFAPDGSAISIAIRGQGDELAVSFADQGPGLPAGFLKTIGERFNILQPVLNRGGEVQGLGLGLSLAKRISDVVGGRLEFSANDPTGTVATLILSGHGLNAADADQARSG